MLFQGTVDQVHCILRLLVQMQLLCHLFDMILLNN